MSLIMQLCCLALTSDAFGFLSYAWTILGSLPEIMSLKFNSIDDIRRCIIYVAKSKIKLNILELISLRIIYIS